MNAPHTDRVVVTLADSTQLPGVRPDLLNVGDILARCVRVGAGEDESVRIHE